MKGNQHQPKKSDVNVTKAAKSCIFHGTHCRADPGWGQAAPQARGAEAQLSLEQQHVGQSWQQTLLLLGKAEQTRLGTQKGQGSVAQGSPGTCDADWDKQEMEIGLNPGVGSKKIPEESLQGSSSAPPCHLQSLHG